MKKIKVKVNKFKRKRFFILSPTVQANLENELNLSDFKIISKLGKGAFGSVYKCKHI